ncbi:1-phosphofructokinase family hexose kinase [Stutzerimonas marianensis]
MTAHRILTLTLSPALDLATCVPHLRPHDKLRCSTPSYAPGGGGINVARAIRRLGGDALALFPAGGSTGEHLRELLKAEDVPFQAIAVSGWTRECINITNLTDRQQYRFVLPGNPLSSQEQTAVLSALEHLPTADFLVISGSMPEALPADFLPRLLENAQRRGCRCIVDSSGSALRQMLDIGGLLLIKPNLDELSAMLGEAISGPEHLNQVAQDLVAAGRTEAVLVSLGAQGALLVTAEVCERIPAPTVPRRSTVGAGDSLLAAMVLKRASGASWSVAARYGVAAGTAAIMTDGSELSRLEDTERLYGWLAASS